MKHEYKVRYAKCKRCSYDNAVEPNQAMSVQDLLVAYSRGMDLPQRIGSYDGETVDINEVGYNCPDHLSAVDFINATNQRLALAKRNAEQEKAVSEPITTDTTNTNVSE